MLYGLRRHCDKNPLHELEVFVFLEYAGLDHPVVFVHVQQTMHRRHDVDLPRYGHVRPSPPLGGRSNLSQNRRSGAMFQPI